MKSYKVSTTNVTIDGGDSTVDKSDLISDEVGLIITSVNYAVLNEVICLFGIVTNILTIVVLVKQGFRKTVNISLMGLSIADLLSVFFKACMGVAFNPLLWDDNLAFIPTEMSILTVSWPHAAFTRISGWITAFITLERCLCVAIPLTIKRVLTPGRNCIVLVCIYVGVIAGVMPNYYTNRISWKFVPEKNRTFLGIIQVDGTKDIDSISLSINNVFSPLINFGLVIVCTAILVYNLNAKSKWRKDAIKITSSIRNSFNSVSPQASSVSSKDAKVIKLVVAISSVFIASSIPTTACFIWMIADTDVNIVRHSQSVYEVLASSTYIFESANSSVSLFVYTHNSTDFRNTFHTVLNACGRCRNNRDRNVNGDQSNPELKTNSVHKTSITQII